MEANPSLEQRSTQAAPGGDSSSYKWKVLFAIVFGTFMVILDSTAVNVALPTLQKAFGTPNHPLSIDQVGGALTAYTLALGIVTPLAGFFSDRFGIKRTYLISQALFVLGSILCSFAPSLPFLIAFRALQGLGGGMVAPLGTALLFGAFKEEERGMAFGVYGIPLVVAPASGPVLGGYFVQYLNWHYIFYINIPIGVIGIILGLLWLRESRRGSEAKLDVPGTILSVVSFGTLLYGIESGQSKGWTSPLIISCLSIGVVAFIALIIVELRTKDPLLNLRLFAKRTYASANIVGWVSSIALFGAEFLMPIYLQSIRGESPLSAGLLVLPLAIASGIVVPIAGALYNRIGGRWLIAFGCILLAFNTWELAHITTDTSYIYLMGLLAVRGVALGCVLQTTLTTAVIGLKPAQLPRASSLINATRNVFQSFGVALLSTVVATRSAAYLSDDVKSLYNPSTDLGKQFMQHVQTLLGQHVPAAAAPKVAYGQMFVGLFKETYVHGLNDAYYVTFGLALLALVLSFTLPARPRKQESAEGEQVAATVQPATH